MNPSTNPLKYPQDALKAINHLQEENTQLKKELQGLSKLKIQVLKEQLQNKLESHLGVTFLATEVDLDAQGMKDLSFELGATLDNVVLILASQANQAPLMSCYISKPLVAEKDGMPGKSLEPLGVISKVEVEGKRFTLPQEVKR